jgi:hypothetical protein
MWRCLFVTTLSLLLIAACETRKPDIPVEKKASTPAAKKTKAGSETRSGDPSYAYKILRHETPQILPAGADTTVIVRVKNTSDRTWESSSELKLGCYWTDESDTRIPELGGRGSLRKDTPPGESVAFKSRVRCPPEPGNYYLVWDLVEKNVGWFGGKGGSPMKIAVKIE